VLPCLISFPQGATEESPRNSVLFSGPIGQSGPQQLAWRVPGAGRHEMGGEPVDLEQGERRKGGGWVMLHEHETQ